MCSRSDCWALARICRMVTNHERGVCGHARTGLASSGCLDLSRHARDSAADNTIVPIGSLYFSRNAFAIWSRSGLTR
jgi:hypothetical protein